MTAPMPSEVRLSQPRDFLKPLFRPVGVRDELVDALGAEKLRIQSSPSRATGKTLPCAVPRATCPSGPPMHSLLIGSDGTEPGLRGGSSDLQIRVPLDQFLRAVILEADRQLPLLAFALHLDDRSDPYFEWRTRVPINGSFEERAEPDADPARPAGGRPYEERP